MKQMILAVGLGLGSLCVYGTAYSQNNTANLTFGPRQENIGKRVDDIVAVVGNDVITRREYNQLPTADRRAGLNRLIMRKLLLQAAQQHNISVGDTAVNIAMQNQPKGQSLDRDFLREELIIAKLRQRVVNSIVKISDAEVNNAVNQQLQTLDGTARIVDVLIRVPQSSDPAVLNQVQAQKREIQQKLKRQSGAAVAAQYPNAFFNDLGWVELNKVPPSFAKVLVDLPINTYAKPIVDRDGIHILKITDRKLKDVGGKAPQQSRVSHILIGKDAPNAQKTINQLYRELKKGADFARLAKTFSQDPGSAAAGGDLNWVSRGQMVPEFEAMMLKTPVGQLSKPFKSQFGYHVLVVTDRREQPVNNHKALQDQAKQSIFQQRALEEWNLWLARLREESHVEIREKAL